MNKLTPRQLDVLAFLRAYIKTNGYPPTMREIAGHLKITGNLAVLNHLKALEEKGVIRRGAGAREIQILEESPGAGDLVQVPILGHIRAGAPELATENIEGYYPMERTQLRGGRFFLRVKGLSMIEDGILPGDLALIRSQATADNGDTVAALVEEDATLKRFYSEQEGRLIRLEPRNSEMRPLIFTEGNVRILGKLVKIIRDY